MRGRQVRRRANRLGGQLQRGQVVPGEGPEETARAASIAPSRDPTASSPLPASASRRAAATRDRPSSSGRRWEARRPTRIRATPRGFRGVGSSRFRRPDVESREAHEVGGQDGQAVKTSTSFQAWLPGPSPPAHAPADQRPREDRVSEVAQEILEVLGPSRARPGSARRARDRPPPPLSSTDPRRPGPGDPVGRRRGRLPSGEAGPRRRGAHRTRAPELRGSTSLG